MHGTIKEKPDKKIKQISLHTLHRGSLVRSTLPTKTNIFLFIAVNANINGLYRFYDIDCNTAFYVNIFLDFKQDKCVCP